MATARRTTDAGASDERRLDSWKEIAAYLAVSVRTAQRWEKLEGLPVKRQRHRKLASPFAFVSELEAWRRARTESARETFRPLPVNGSAAFEGSRKSIAVLPFANLDRDDATEVICDGLTEELITALSQVGPLKVVARSSSFYFKDKSLDVRKIGAKLGVETVLQGSIRREGDRLRVAAQLSHTHDGCHLWARRFDRIVTDLLDLQDELARAITEALSIQLESGGALARRETSDPRLYNLFLKGRYFWNQRSREGLENALGCYQRVLREDPTFASAHAGIADCHVFLWAYGGEAWDDVVRCADAASAEALAIDPASSDAHTSFGLTRLIRYDADGADRAFRRALALSPSDGRARHWGAMTAASLGRLEEGLAKIHRTLELDPFGMTANQDLGRILYFAGRVDEAIHQFLLTLEIAPHAPSARLYLVFAYLQLGRDADAMEVAEAEPMLRAFVRARTGRPDEARRVLRAKSSGPHTWKALLNVGLGRSDAAIEHLTAAVAHHEPMYLELCPSVQPIFEPLRRDPKFRALPLTTT